MTHSIFSQNGKLDLSAAKKFHGASMTCSAITIIRTSSGDRTKISKGLLADLGNPSWLDFYLTDNQVIIVPASDKAADSMKVGKNEIVYNAQLAREIMEVAGIDFPENKSTPIGSYTLEAIDEETQAAVVTFNSSTTHAVDTAD